VLHKEIPFLRILVPLCLGIITGLYFTPGVFLLVVIAIIVVAGFCISLFFNRYQSNLFYGIAFTLSMFLFGLTIYTIEKGRLSLLDPEPATFLCMLSDYPEEKENSYKFTVRLRQKIEKPGNIRLNGSLIVYNRKDTMPPSFLPGDYLIIKCTPIEIINRANPNEFDYRFYMENQGIKYFAFTQSSDIRGHIAPKRRNLAHRALIIREGIIDLYRKSNIGNERLAIIAAITLGQKNMLDPDQKQNFI
jgi:competence protein ComEC